MSDRTTLAHLSDIHLPFGLPAGHQLLTKRGLSALSWLTNRRKKHLASVARTLKDDLVKAAPDLIALGGDLINFGTRHEFKASRQWLEELGSPEEVVVVPGNHEAMAPGWRKYIAEWGEYFSLNQDHAPVLKAQGVIGLIAVSTARATPPFIANGRVEDRHVEVMSELITKARKSGLCPIVLMHHPPTAITSKRRGLDNGEVVCRAFAKSGASLVLHGHTHHAELSWIEASNDVIPVLGIPSFSLAKHDGRNSGAWRLIDVERQIDQWLITVTERTLDQDGNLFSLTPITFSQPINSE